MAGSLSKSPIVSPRKQRHLALRTLTKIKLPFWPPMHPAPRRCSLLTYSRYARSSRLAGQAPRHPEGGNFILISVLSERPRRQAGPGTQNRRVGCGVARAAPPIWSAPVQLHPPTADSRTAGPHPASHHRREPDPQGPRSWGDQRHAVQLQPAAGGPVEQIDLEQRPDALHAWVAHLRQRLGGRPVGSAIEQRKGAVMDALMQYEFLVLYPINPIAGALSRGRSATRHRGLS